MTSEEVRDFFILRARALRMGYKLHLCKSASQQRRGYAWISTKASSTPITYFDSLDDVAYHVGVIEEGTADDAA